MSVTNHFGDMILTLVQDKTTFTEMMVECWRHDVIGFDTETNSLDTLWSGFKLAGFSLATSPYRGWYVPLQHRRPKHNALLTVPLEQVDLSWALQNMKRLLETKKIVGHNLKYDYRVMLRHDIDINIWFDTMIAAVVVDERRRRRALKALVQEELNREVTLLNQVLEDKKIKDFTTVRLEDALLYAGPDACNPMALHRKFEPEIRENNDLSRIFWEVEMPCIKPTADMELAGIVLDKTKAHELLEELSREIERTSAEITDMIQDLDAEWATNELGEFQASSNNHIACILYDEGFFGLEDPSKEGNRAVDNRAFESLEYTGLDKRQQAFIDRVREYRRVSKLRSTYVKPLLGHITDTTQRLHPSFVQMGARSGRFTSEKPNSQNIPREAGKFNSKGERQYDIRSMMTVAAGKILVVADYDSMEIKVTAAISQCPVLKPIETELILFSPIENMLRTFADTDVVSAKKDGWIKVDMHKFTASKIFRKPYSEVTKDERQEAKPVNFGIIYGISKYGLARDLRIDPQEAQIFIDGFMVAYPGVASWILKSYDHMMKHKYTKTFFGRRRRMPSELYGKDRKTVERMRVLRYGCNHEVQGTSADIVKMALAKIHHVLKENRLDAKIVGQVHDEILVETDPYIAEDVGRIMQTNMYFVLCGVPLTATPEFKLTWSKEKQDVSHKIQR